MEASQESQGPMPKEIWGVGMGLHFPALTGNLVRGPERNRGHSWCCWAWGAGPEVRGAGEEGPLASPPRPGLRAQVQDRRPQVWACLDPEGTPPAPAPPPPGHLAPSSRGINRALTCALPRSHSSSGGGGKSHGGRACAAAGGPAPRPHRDPPPLLSRPLPVTRTVA